MEILGKGGQAKVFKVINKDNSLVAMKIYKVKDFDQEFYNVYLQREIAFMKGHSMRRSDKTCKKDNRKYLVKLIESFQDKDGKY